MRSRDDFAAAFGREIEELVRRVVREI